MSPPSSDNPRVPVSGSGGARTPTPGPLVPDPLVPDPLVPDPLVPDPLAPDPPAPSGMA
jgi:hypothetical protein